MITVLSSPKPGSGTSTTAALLALAGTAPTDLVDLGGDQTRILGFTGSPSAIGPVSPHPTVHDVSDNSVGEQAALIGQLADRGGHVVIDAGDACHPIHHVRPSCTVRRWVIRPCYLALSRVAACPMRPDEVILLVEPGRSLTVRNVESVVGAQVTAVIDVHPQIARAVDADVLATRAPITALASLTTSGLAGEVA